MFSCNHVSILLELFYSSKNFTMYFLRWGTEKQKERTKTFELYHRFESAKFRWIQIDTCCSCCCCYCPLFICELCCGIVNAIADRGRELKLRGSYMILLQDLWVVMENQNEWMQIQQKIYDILKLNKKLKTWGSYKRWMEMSSTESQIMLKRHNNYINNNNNITNDNKKH